MTNKTQLVSVPRELLQHVLNAVKYLSLRGDDVGTSNVPVADALRSLLSAPAEDVRAVVEQTLDPVHGDVLPPIGSKVCIELGSSGWDEQTVTGYYVWPSHGLDKNVHRVFVRVKDAEGTPNARLLADVRTSAQATSQ
jgi:hypothetical protein